MIWTSVIECVVIADPEERRTGSGKDLAQCRVMFREHGKKEGEENPPTFFKIVGWGEMAGRVAKLKKGHRVIVTGKSRIERWTGSGGAERTGLVVTVSIIDYVDSPKSISEKREKAVTREGVEGPATSAPKQTEWEGVDLSDAEVPF